jgi:formamidopyrimidine-DNA glycosylase
VPELPDLTVYIEALTARLLGQPLAAVRVLSPFVLRSVDPPVSSIVGRPVRGVFRVGKRIVLTFDAAAGPGGPAVPAGDDLFLVLHLMVAGRLRWRLPGQKLGMSGKLVLATLEFDAGTLFFTEAGTTKRASLQLVRGLPGVEALNPGGVEPLGLPLAAFREALIRENHTLKRTLTDPHLFSGIGNAYSDEILHAARLSPLALTRKLSEDEIARLHEASRATLTMWIERLRAAANGAFPEKVTAFPEGMAVHGRFKQPCPVCGAPIQRIVYADNECNYCARCQTGGRVLADRALSRLLKTDWPRSLDR